MTSKEQTIKALTPRHLLLSTDHSQSLLRAVGEMQTAAYTPFGYFHRILLSKSRLAFNGEPPDLSANYYPLGKGYRTYNPILGRFHAYDSLSPFGGGGLNGYSYCGGDPINNVDPSGHAPVPVGATSRAAKKIPKARVGSSTSTITKSQTTNKLSSYQTVMQNRRSRIAKLEEIINTHQNSTTSRRTVAVASMSFAEDHTLESLEQLKNAVRIDFGVGKGSTSHPDLTPFAYQYPDKTKALYTGHLDIIIDYYERLKNRPNLSRSLKSKIKQQLNIATLNKHAYILENHNKDLSTLRYVTGIGPDNLTHLIRNP